MTLTATYSGEELNVTFVAAAKLAEVEAERDHWEAVAIARQAKQQAAEAHIAHLENHIEAVAKDAHKIMVAYAAPLPAVYRLALEDAAYEVHQECWTDGPAGQIATEALLAEQDATALAIKSIRALPTPTAAELMARINGPKQRSGGACDSCGYNVQKPCKTKADRQNCEFAP